MQRKKFMGVYIKMMRIMTPELCLPISWNENGKRKRIEEKKEKKEEESGPVREEMTDKPKKIKK